MREKNILLAGNWKMNNGPKAAAQFFASLKFAPKANARARLYLPYLSLTAGLESVAEAGLPIEIGAQNLHFEKSGAFTGEISGTMLQEIGITQVLVGHSERRQYFNETDDTVLKRTVSALEQNFEVLLCVGETEAQRKANQTESVLTTQLKQVLDNEKCRSAFGIQLQLAYEPVWAIGTGVTATPEQAEAAHAFIRKMLSEKLGEAVSQKTLILYGGSVTPVNFKELIQCPNIDGGLVGGASVKAESFQALWDLL